MGERHVPGVALSPTRSAAVRPARVWLLCLGMLLGVYAVFGKGTAYIGIGSLYIGETVVLLGLLLVLSGGVGKTSLKSPTFLFLALFAAWGLIGTLPNLPTYGLFALRDAVLWGYGIFVLLVVTALGRIADPVTMIMSFLRWYAPCMVLGAPLVYLGGKAFQDIVPSWPGSDYNLLYHKPGDIMVHLALIYAAVVSGALAWSRWRWALPLTLAAVSVAPFNRGGSVVLLLVGGLSIIPRKNDRRWPLVVLGIAAGLISLLAVSGLRIELNDYNKREISFQQLTDNVASLFGREVQGNQLDNTSWRLRWWWAIAEKLPAQGHEWTGVGFGPHIAREFGIDDTPIEVRSPHNVWMTIFARMGYIGLLLWVGMLVSWFWTVRRGLRHARRIGVKRRAALLVTALLAMPGFMFNASVDIFLEGPVGGIWFWCLMGVGLALAQVRPIHVVSTKMVQN